MMTLIKKSTSTESQNRVAHDVRMVIEVCNELEKSIKTGGYCQVPQNWKEIAKAHDSQA